MSETHPSPRPPHSPPQVVPPPGQETTWHKSFCDESSSCLVDAWSGPPLAWAHSTVSPDPHCPSSSSCSALCERNDGRRAEQSGCVLFMHAFRMALSTFHPCFGKLSFLIVLLYRCFLLFFGLLSSPAFVCFAFCLADKFCGGFSDHKCQWIFMFSSHAALVLVLFGCLNRHTQNQSTPSPYFLCFYFFSVSPLCAFQSFAQRQKWVRVSTKCGACGRKGHPRLSLALSLWIELYIHIGSSTQWPIAPWHASWCQKARNARYRV